MWRPVLAQDATRGVMADSLNLFPCRVPVPAPLVLDISQYPLTAHLLHPSAAPERGQRESWKQTTLMADSSRLTDPSLVTSRGVNVDTGAAPAAISVPTSPFNIAATFAIELVSHLSALQQRLPSSDTTALVATTGVATLVLFYIAR
ncbi:hypothetical protein ACRALDRAFT_2023337, partial [Sodiomyces alcalophilus JCM 7366]|uniref:uncharacterized protein n=1 Tax=Sodiomyces alcalophilus JCM 7366 TaxID=591952 RepID=UPI0039B4DD64